MPNEILEIPYDQANEVTRQFAYAAAIAHGFNPMDNVFWQIFMGPRIHPYTWLHSRSYREIVISHFKDGIIRMPSGFLDWEFMRGQWRVTIHAEDIRADELEFVERSSDDNG